MATLVGIVGFVDVVTVVGVLVARVIMVVVVLKGKFVVALFMSVSSQQQQHYPHQHKDRTYSTAYQESLCSVGVDGFSIGVASKDGVVCSFIDAFLKVAGLSVVVLLLLISLLLLLVSDVFSSIGVVVLFTSKQ